MSAQAKPSFAEWLLGATLATPLLANLIPYPLLLALAAAPLGLGAIVACRLPGSGLRSILTEIRSNHVAGLLWLLLAFQVLGVLQSSDPTAPRLLRELLVGGALAILASAARGVAPTEGSALGVFTSFLATCAAVAALCAIIGLLKLFLLERGVVIGILHWLYPTEYPWGSSLKRDYNFFALSILIGMVAIVELWFRSKTTFGHFAWPLLLGVMAASGAYAGSRRFWVVAPIVLAAQLVLTTRRTRAQTAISGRLLSLALVAGIAGTSVVKLVENAPDIDLTWVVKAIGNWTGADVSNLAKAIDAPLEAGREAAGADFRSRASTLVSSSESFGIASRLDRWHYALELVDARTLLVGAGFDYREWFGCRFLNCEDIDYPHNAILSSLLYGGIGALLAACAFVGTVVLLSLRLLRQGGPPSTAGLTLAAAFPFFMISGDTFSSLPGLTALAILASILVAPRQASGLQQRPGIPRSTRQDPGQFPIQ